MTKQLVIGFSRSTLKLPWGSWIIRAYMGMAPYSHCYIKLLTKPRFPSNKILHAAEGQVSHYSETAFLTRNKPVYEFILEIPVNQYEYIKNWIFHEKSGELYSIKQNIGLVWCKILGLFRIKAKNPWSEGWNCSEYVAHVLQQIYPKTFKNQDLNLTTPKDVYLVLEDLAKKGVVQRV